jgi:phytoene dehydrogenase-like protein
MTGGSESFDAVVVGSGPNGLAAAITLAQAGLSVLILEGADAPGGGTRSAELTLPGFTHDLCSAVHPLARASPFFRSVPLADHGLRMVEVMVPAAHPLDGGGAAVLRSSLTQTAGGLGVDGPAYLRLIGPLVRRWKPLIDQLLSPLIPPRHPLLMARFSVAGIRSAQAVAGARFKEAPARALLAGLAAHSVLPLDRSPTAGLGMLLAVLGHAVGWPVAGGGSQAIAGSLVSYFKSLGGEVRTGQQIRSLDELPANRAALLDVSPRQLIGLAGRRLPLRYLRALHRYRHGPGAFKVDWALSGPVPWAASVCRLAGTVHIGGTFEEIAEAELLVARGGHPERPFVIVAQQSLFDPTRAPDGKHTLWGYCHVPNGSDVDMTRAIEAQIERFAPGFRDLILARSVKGPGELEHENPNYIGGDIVGGSQDLIQTLARPVPSLNPYATPARGVYLCSASTPPGAGVHGMCGFHAARAALRREFGLGA